jgi:hypothetical protein
VDHVEPAALQVAAWLLVGLAVLTSASLVAIAARRPATAGEDRTQPDPAHAVVGEMAA